ncbi:MAG: indolepyruvate ferredoxin oxidoreductase subunit alpha, partial [Clostridiaceae bacterium]|nr:indolepyruvate ferredoxin oxidoreductase subunit alpha [Clostridiaceae bacterium]
MLMLGNEAVARGAYEAGCTVATAYPGTPSTEITEYIAQKYDEIYSEWAPNEKVALEVAIGASIIGARAMCSMKHVGLNVAADPLFTASYTGVGGGLVICVADDPGMHSSQNEQDTRMLGIASKVMVLEPSDSQECKDFVKEAFSLSELFDTPVIVRLSTRVSHSQSIVEIADRNDYTYKKYEKNPLKYVMMPAMARKRHVEVVKRLSKIKEFAESCGLNKIEMNDTKI